ncbi:MAG: DUF1800 domain-containing protein, partial [Stellaceae bacterium]
MVASAALDAVVASTRFGYAARGDELGAIAADPHGWVLRQIGQPVRPAFSADLPTSQRMVAMLFEMRRDKQQADRKAFNQRVRDVYLTELAARTDAAVSSSTPFIERLVHFWSNHFTVSGFRPFVRGFAFAFEREAIRPYVTGRFVDMLLAAERHPAMLLYLDNALSIGPDSLVGLRRNKGINENFGREMLELHTLGVDGGYIQADVIALARILTGWSVARLNDAEPGTFKFYPQIHEPGPKQLLGKVYAETGEQEGIAALRDLANHPATAHHIAFKLAQHFIADVPPRAAVDQIAKVFRNTGGNLAAVSKAVVALEAAWSKPFGKMRTPGDMVTAACRAANFTPPAPFLAGGLRTLNQLPFYAPSPAGWPDDAASWISPEAVLHRAEWCETFANRVPGPPDPIVLA